MFPYRAVKSVIHALTISAAAMETAYRRRRLTAFSEGLSRNRFLLRTRKAQTGKMITMSDIIIFSLMSRESRAPAAEPATPAAIEGAARRKSTKRFRIRRKAATAVPAGRRHFICGDRRRRRQPRKKIRRKGDQTSSASDSVHQTCQKQQRTHQKKCFKT